MRKIVNTAHVLDQSRLMMVQLLVVCPTIKIYIVITDMDPKAQVTVSEQLKFY
jgi:hypothetical protein